MHSALPKTEGIHFLQSAEQNRKWGILESRGEQLAWIYLLIYFHNQVLLEGTEETVHLSAS